MMKKPLSEAKAFIGSCEHMCPEKERAIRMEFRVSVFERDENNQPDENAMVKEYRRAGADQEEPASEDLRTPKALETTMNYLVCNLMDDERSLTPDFALEWYDFLWDRLRAIRKDITQQSICDQASVKLVERCARFHIHSCYAMNRVKDFDANMNKRNLNDCLQMLRQMYTDLRQEGQECDGELEFQKYDLLLHLDEETLSTTVNIKESNHRTSDEMKFVIRIFTAYCQNNYHLFFKLMAQADYMTACLLSLYSNNMRLAGLKIITEVCTNNKQKDTLYPADLVMESLGFNDLEDMREFASALSIEIREKDSKPFLLLCRNKIDDTSLPALKSKNLVEDKKDGKPVGYMIYGGEIETSYDYEETSPVHRSVIENVYSSDEDYSLESENDDFSSTKSSVDSLTSERSEEAVDELEECEEGRNILTTTSTDEEEETTTEVTTHTTTCTKQQQEDLEESEEVERRRTRSSTRADEQEELDEVDEEEQEEVESREWAEYEPKVVEEVAEEEEEEDEEEQEEEEQEQEETHWSNQRCTDIVSVPDKKRCADSMPAGKFKRFRCRSWLMAELPNPAGPPKKKRVHPSKGLDRLKERVSDEICANDRLLKLLQFIQN